jgi:chromosome segregation ATPase
VLKQYIIGLLLLVLGFNSFGQSPLVTFNKTEHDFGELAQTAFYFEHDFLFRNTSDSAATILSVRSVSESLEFIHTRSDVLSGEYGFIKVKILTDSLNGLFHDEVYVTLRIGESVQSEVLYIRAQVEDRGQFESGRQFEDSEIAVSVEVSPEDIQTLEGFMGTDQLARAESEINYLKKQVALKTLLIERLSTDLHEKQENEEQSILRMHALEESLNESKQDFDTSILVQIADINSRLEQMKASDSVTQDLIHDQEMEYLRLKAESDSAQAYANNLSVELQEQFQKQAEAMERATKLQADLSEKQLIESDQRAQIDSLEDRIQRESASTTAVGAEIETIRTELAWKKKEQELQNAHAQFQHKKIDRLKESKSELEALSDSLSINLKVRSAENENLKGELAQTSKRIENFESQIDSLALLSQNGIQNKEELKALKHQLDSIEAKDLSLKSEIAQKDAELSTLESQKAKTQKNLKALEIATSRQLEETHNLMHRVNNLSKKEAEAHLEIVALRDELNKSQDEMDRKKIVYDTKSRALNTELDNAKLSNQIVFEELKNEVAIMQRERDSMRLANDQSESKNKELTSTIERLNSERELLIDASSSAPVSNVYYRIKLGGQPSLEALSGIAMRLEIYVRESNGKVNTSVGHFSSIKEAIQTKDSLTASGYQRAVVEAYRNGERIPLKEAVDTASIP